MLARLPPALRDSAVMWGLAVVLLMSAVYAGLYGSHIQAGSNDPDRFYHLALSRLSSEQGLLRSLPQVEDLGWGQYFPDKEFLFHVLTAAGYRLNGDAGALAVIPLLGVGIVGLLYLTLRREIPPWKAALVTLFPVLVTTVFLYRLMLLRPHVLAIFFFCLLLAAILQRQRLLAVLAVFGFVLSYHAFYVPLLCILLAWPLRRTVVRPDGLWLGWMLTALLAGLLLNPYFPSNLEMAFTHARIALGAGLPPGLDAGVEVQALPLRQFVVRYDYLVLGAGLALGSYALGVYRGGTQRLEYRYLLGVTLAFTLLSVQSSRAAEYAIPALILLTGYSLRHFDSVKSTLAVCLCCAGLQWSDTHAAYHKMLTADLQFNGRLYMQVLDLLPPEAAGKKVFNCEWAFSPYLFYSRPQLRFVDILDPTLLWVHDPAKYLVRQRLIAGQSTQPADDLRQVFDTDYVFCTTDALLAQMRADPANFAPVAETRTRPVVALYEVRR